MRVDKASDLRTISSRNIVLVRIWGIGNESGADLRVLRGAAAIFAWGLQLALRRAQRFSQQVAIRSTGAGVAPDWRLEQTSKTTPKAPSVIWL